MKIPYQTASLTSPTVPRHWSRGGFPAGAPSAEARRSIGWVLAICGNLFRFGPGLGHMDSSVEALLRLDSIQLRAASYFVSPVCQFSTTVNCDWPPD